MIWWNAETGEGTHTTSIWMNHTPELHEGVHREVALGPKEASQEADLILKRMQTYGWA